MPGLIATHIVEPIALRSILPRLPRMLLDPTAPLAIRWWYLPTLLPWLVRLLRATAPAEVERIAKSLAGQLARADEAWRELAADAGAEALMRRDGVIMVYPDRAYVDANAAEMLELRRRNGVPFEILGDNALRARLPALSRDYRVGVHFTGAGHTVDPFLLVSALARRFLAGGGALHRAHATGFALAGDRVTAVRTADGDVAATSRCWPRASGRGRWRAGSAARVPLDSERGYHVMLADPGIDARPADDRRRRALRGHADGVGHAARRHDRVRRASRRRRTRAATRCCSAMRARVLPARCAPRSRRAGWAFGRRCRIRCR